MNSLLYKGYAARIDFSNEDDCFIGHIVGIKDVIGFHGDTVKELKNSFYEAVDDYNEACDAIGKKTTKTLFRKFNVMCSSRSTCSGCNSSSSTWCEYKPMGFRCTPKRISIATLI